jgi:molecular chaperone GrpE
MAKQKRNTRQNRRDDANEAPEQQRGEAQPAPTEEQTGERDDQAATEVEELIEVIELPDEVVDRLRALQDERDAAVAARQRALADFANFQRRSRENETRARADGVTSVIRSLLPVLDQFDLALAQSPEKLTVEQLLQGVKIVQQELWKAMRQHEVEIIHPQPGEEFDPNHHQAMMRQPTDEFAPGTVVSVMQPGYTIGGVALRAASVSVAAPLEDAGAGEQQKNEGEAESPESPGEPGDESSGG